MPNIPSELYGEILPVPHAARIIHAEITAELSNLEKLNLNSCLDLQFRNIYNKVLDLFDKYQSTILTNSSITCTCKSGCSFCCYHWVEDVNSFEAEIISDYLRSNMPEKIPQIIKICTSDQDELERLFTIIQNRLKDESENEEIDETDLLLSVFYQMKRPCPLLDINGNCSIYPVRPLTCRVYMSFSDPSFCHPAYINDEYIPTYLLNLEDDANTILDRLHFKYQKFEGDTGLRSLLIEYLQTIGLKH